MSYGYPNVLEMEKKLLSALFLKEGKVIPTVSTILHWRDFYREEHRVIYRAILRIYQTGVPPDPLLVEEELKRTNELVKINRKYLYGLTDYEFTTSRAEKFARAIKEKATLRQLIETCEEISEIASHEKNSLEEILEEAERRIFLLNSKSAQEKLTDSKTILNKSLAEITFRFNNKVGMTGVKTSLIELDGILNGLQKSDLILLAARPSMGKTALALNIGTNAARIGKIVAIFSLEMSQNQLGYRLLSTSSGVEGQKINQGNLSGEELSKIVQAVDELSDLKMYIDDTVGIGIFEMRSKLRRLKQETGLDLVIIDYLQLMQGSRRAENRQQEISEISRNLKGMARELNVPVLALSQLSRSVELRAEKKPQLSDLRESGSLEQDADIVMFLYREEYYNRNDDNESLAELIIAKNRNGPTTSVRLHFNKKIMKFGNLTRAAE